ncbi:MAG: 5-formyltetrahydrofolate cyclo-ligase [Actinomycetes bacterium]
MTTESELRSKLRVTLREIRRSIPFEQRSAAQQAASERVVEFAARLSPGRICTYMASDGELDVNARSMELRSLGWRIFLPVIGQSKQMQFAQWIPGEDLEANRFGIPEPASPRELLSPNQMDLALVPCVAVDESGNRLGFGAGFYDRAFATQLPQEFASSGQPIREPRTVLVGCAFDLQVVDQFGSEPWDVPMNYILTESKLTRVNRQNH